MNEPERTSATTDQALLPEEKPNAQLQGPAVQSSRETRRQQELTLLREALQRWAGSAFALRTSTALRPTDAQAVESAIHDALRLLGDFDRLLAEEPRP